MIAPLLPLLLGARPRIVLKASRDPVDAMFQPEPREKAKAVWVDGKDTGVRIPPIQAGFFEIEERSNARGDLGGEFSEGYRGAMNGTYHYPFLMLKGGRFTLLPQCGDNAYVVAMDGRGRLLAVDDPPMTNLTEVCHGYVWVGSDWTDLGPADRMHFERDGSVVGSFPTSRKGRPLERIDYGGEGFRVRFRWKDGKRTESKPYQA